jgi:hypothetical protein
MALVRRYLCNAAMICEATLLFNIRLEFSGTRRSSLSLRLFPSSQSRDLELFGVWLGGPRLLSRVFSHLFFGFSHHQLPFASQLNIIQLSIYQDTTAFSSQEPEHIPWPEFSARKHFSSLRTNASNTSFSYSPAQKTCLFFSLAQFYIQRLDSQMSFLDSTLPFASSTQCHSLITFSQMKNAFSSPLQKHGRAALNSGYQLLPGLN